MPPIAHYDPAQEYTLKESRALVNRLSESKIFQDYEKAFLDSTGLPLAIRPVKSFQMAVHGKTTENPFCSLMASTNKSCLACLEMQADLEKTANLEPKSLHCFAGLCDTFVPIRIGEKSIAFLQTGQVLLHDPSHDGFKEIARQILDWGAKVDLENLEEAYFQTRVLDEEQYTGFINMLTIFAQHLSIIGNSIKIKESAKHPHAVIRSLRYIEENHDRHLNLEEASKAVNMSVRYFCKIFKKSTSMTFVEYLSHLRIEKSKDLLLNPHKSISETAFQVGFESITQFNRTFKKIAGQTPTQYRESA